MQTEFAYLNNKLNLHHMTRRGKKKTMVAKNVASTVPKRQENNFGKDRSLWP